jgi:hypothetical protein
MGVGRYKRHGLRMRQTLHNLGSSPRGSVGVIGRAGLACPFGPTESIQRAWGTTVDRLSMRLVWATASTGGP